jgi:hypothetical protein
LGLGRRGIQRQISLALDSFSQSFPGAADGANAIAKESTNE